MVLVPGTARTRVVLKAQLKHSSANWMAKQVKLCLPFSCSAAAIVLSPNPMLPLTLSLCHRTGHVVQQHAPSCARLTLTSSCRAERYLLESCRSWALRNSQTQAVGVSQRAKTLSWLNPWLLLEPKDLPSAAAFTTHQPGSWQRLIANSKSSSVSTTGKGIPKTHYFISYALTWESLLDFCINNFAPETLIITIIRWFLPTHPLSPGT